MKSYYQALFDPGEAVCWSKDPYGTAVRSLEDLDRYSGFNFVTINPLHLNKDLAVTEAYHSPFIGRRADANVSCFRNILCEFDGLSLEQQKELVKDIPYATLVYSGGKSLHAVISLESPVATRQQYDSLVSRVYAKLSGVDKSGRNPSRFTRAPGAVRGSVTQDLLDVRQRCSTLALEAWLGPAPVVEASAPDSNIPRVLKHTTNMFLLRGSPVGGWNNSLFKAAADMTRAGYSLTEIINICTNITGYLDSNDLSTINSAHRTARRDLESSFDESDIQSSD